MNDLALALRNHISALRRRANHHRKQKLTAASKAAATDHLMCMTELTREADELNAIVEQHTRNKER